MSRFLTLLIVVFIVTPLFGLDLPVRQIPDDSPLRILLKDSWLTESPSRVLTRRTVSLTLDGGNRVEIRVESGRNEFMVIFARELMRGRMADDGSPDVPRTNTGLFPGWAQGSWMITRSLETGQPMLIRVFPRSDQFTYIQFRPFTSDKCQMDVVLYGSYAVQSLPLPVPFERLYTMPVNDVLRLAGDKFPLKYFEPNPMDYAGQRRFIGMVRQRLPQLRFADDGAINEDGDYVFINTLEQQNEARGGLNCSGFAKWLIDGILRPVTGRRLAIPPLKEPFGSRGSSFTELHEESRDPFFGLDWIRNLAAEAGSVLRSPAYSSLDEIEVRSEVFSQVLVPVNRAFSAHSYTGFLQDAGYGIEGLHPLLYTLAIDEPGRFYLAAVNTEMGPASTPENLRGGARMRQYFHIAALVPYFTEYGDFRIVVFESAAETSFNAFRTRYPEHHVNLVRIPLETAFDP
ncbi:MAG: hypothetical protein FWG99_08830 [Treponema sp.]|nr:hypothetical protein [Treponema sp.]